VLRLVSYHPKITVPKDRKMNIITKAPAASFEPWTNSSIIEASWFVDIWRVTAATVARRFLLLVMFHLLSYCLIQRSPIDGMSTHARVFS
jgi:hypothetical protein